MTNEVNMCELIIWTLFTIIATVLPFIGAELGYRSAGKSFKW